jgi:hypothetical protein
MKYLSIQTFQCGISVSGAATFTGGATINVLALNGATTSSEASLFLGAHGANEGGQLVLQKGTGQTYAAHLDNYNDQFRILYGTNTGSTGIALAVSLSTRQLILPAYTSSSSFSGTAAGYLAFDSSGNIITTSVPVSGVSSIIAGTGVTVSSGTGNVTVSIGQSVATSATPSFDQIFLTNNGNGTNVKIGDDAWIGDVNAANTLRIMGQQNNADGYIIFGNSDFTALGRSGTGNLTYGGSTVWTAATLTNLNQLTNGPGYITSAALAGYVPTSRTLTINGTSYDLSADRTWTINTVAYTSRLQHQVKAGVAINKGQAVYVTSADGTNMIVGLASNASEATSSKTMGLLDATVSTNGFANVVTEGLLAGLDTSTAGTEGDPVWLGTGGNLIYGLINKPYAPAHLVFIGIVTRKNNSNGEIFVKVQNGFELNEIHDVDLKTTAPINGHLLGFDGTLWVNKTIAGWLGYTPANASGTTNYISKFTGSTTLGNSQVFDDGTNVGIGTTTMFGKLSISSGNSNGIRIDTNGGGYSALNIGGTGSLTVDAPGITGGRFQITDSGNVGIGNPSPSFKVHIKSSGLNSYPLVVQRAANTNNIFYIYEDGSGNGTLTLENSGGGAAVSLNSSGSSYLTGGNVGIGTTSPSQKLDVNGYAKFTSGIILDGGATSHYREFIWNTSGFNRWDLYVYGAEPGSNVGGDLFLARYADNGAYISNTVTFQRSTGNVGIGTSNPSYQLQITAAAANDANFLLDGTDRDWLFQSKTGTGLFNIFDNTASASRLAIDSSGNVGIGTTSPQDPLHIATSGGDKFIRIENSNSYTGLWLNDSGTNSGWLVLSGYTNTPSPGDFAIREYGVQTSLTIKQTTGNVGIGTTSPSEKLHVAGNIVLGSTANGYQEAGSKYIGLSYPSLGTDGYVGFQFESVNAPAPYNGNYSQNIKFYTHHYAAGTGGTPRMTIQYDGNVGIGTVSPNATLQVANTTSGNAFSMIGSNSKEFVSISYLGYLRSRASDTNGANMHFADNGNIKRMEMGVTTTSMDWYSDALASNFLTFQHSTGRVGIGTASPSHKLHLYGASDQLIKVENTGTYLMYAGLISNEGYIGSTNATPLGFYTNNVNRIYITTAGNVGIGTTSPSAKLEIAGSNSTLAISYGNTVPNNPLHTSYYGGYTGIGMDSATAGVRIVGDTNVLVMDAGYYTSNVIQHASWNSLLRVMTNGNVGIGTTTPATKLEVNGVITATGGNSTNWNTAYGWGNHASASYVPQARTLTINGTSYDLSANRSWTIATTTPGGSDTQVQYNSSGSLAGTSALTYNSTTNRVGINQASPGYDLDVNGQVRVQDKLRIGTGNGVVHMSSSATINPSATTVVWAQTVSVGMCAFIEYYILNNNSLTDQRAGTIMVTWNQSGTPTIAHTETTTPDIGSTTAINFTSSLVGSDARINAVNSSAAPYTIVMSYKYF